MTHTIELYISGREWVSKHSDPELREIFGTDVIPTAFFAAMPAADVLREIERRNPDRIVTLRDAQ